MPPQDRSQERNGSLSGKRIAIIATDGVEQAALIEPREALQAAGATVEIIGTHPGEIQATRADVAAERIPVDRVLGDVSAGEYAGVVLLGTAASLDALRRDRRAVVLVRDFFDQHKPVAANCHASAIFIEADAARGRRLTAAPSLRPDLTTAGAEWIDEPVVVDRGLVTSRSPDDLPQFCTALVEHFRAVAYGGR